MVHEHSTLEVSNLTTYFRVGEDRIARAVDGIGFRLESGRTLALVGESGCGKSQTAFSIIRLLERNGFHGKDSRILFEGEDLLTKTEEDMRRIRGNRIAMIFQEPMSSLNPLFRVGNQLAEPLRLHRGMDGPKARTTAIELLGQVGIPSPVTCIDSYPHELSGGMKQRVMIAMALAGRPRLLIADEPTTALDVTIQAQILSLMKRLQQETGMPILLITHDMGVVHQMADEVCVMYAGRIAEVGSRDDIFSQPRHPYTRRLLESIPASADARFRLRTIPGRVPSATDIHPGCRFCERCTERIEVCAQVHPPFHPGGGSGRHQAACHLLAPDHAGDRARTVRREPRPVRIPSTCLLIEVSDLRTHFPVKRGLLQRTVDHLRAVDGIGLTLRRGETLALVGESGCGKTTVGQSLLRLLKEARGRIKFDGQDILTLDHAGIQRLRRRTQIVFQDPYSSLNPRMRIGSIVGEGLRIHQPSLSARESGSRVRSILERVGLSSGDADRYPHEFSGGQRQRIAIARALILEPDVLVLDEPTSALDVSVQAQILNLLEDIQAERGLAYLFITHDLGVVEYISNTVAVMYLGRFVEVAPTAALFRRPRHPYTQALLAAVPRIGEAAPFRRIEGDVPSPLRPPSGCRFHPRCPFAQPACRQTEPALDPVGDHHHVACLRWADIPE
jgi:peptide/nickel transport system ATP-binding protein